MSLDAIQPNHGICAIPLTALDTRPQPNLADINKIRDLVDNTLNDLYHVASVLTIEDRVRIHQILGIEDLLEGCSPASGVNLDIDEISQQYQLVMKIRNMVLDPSNQIAKGTDVKALTSLTASIGSLMGLWLRSQDKIDHLKEIAHMREAVIHAINDQPAVVRERFFSKLEELNSNDH